MVAMARRGSLPRRERRGACGHRVGLARLEGLVVDDDDDDDDDAVADRKRTNTCIWERVSTGNAFAFGRGEDEVAGGG